MNREATPFTDKNGAPLFIGDRVIYRKKNRKIMFGLYSNGEDEFYGAYIQLEKGFGAGRESAFKICAKVRDKENP